MCLDADDEAALPFWEQLYFGAIRKKLNLPNEQRLELWE